MSKQTKWPTEKEVKAMLADKFGTVENAKNDFDKQALIATEKYILEYLSDAKKLFTAPVDKKDYMDTLETRADGYYDGYLAGLVHKFIKIQLSAIIANFDKFEKSLPDLKAFMESLFKRRGVE
jgi:hypothetical protein